MPKTWDRAFAPSKLLSRDVDCDSATALGRLGDEDNGDDTADRRPVAPLTGVQSATAGARAVQLRSNSYCTATALSVRAVHRLPPYRVPRPTPVVEQYRRGRVPTPTTTGHHPTPAR